MGPPTVTSERLASWFHAHAPAGYRATVTVEELARLYIDEGIREGVRPEPAFAQAILETGWFRWPSGSVRPEFNNFAGMGATDTNPNANRFPDARTGVRAQMQHLRRYADPSATSAAVLHAPLVDVRFDLVQPAGRAPMWSDMGNGNWATSTNDYSGRVIRSTAQIIG